MITIEYKDLTTVTSGIIGHCVNCQGAMGSGVARALFTKWPEVRNEYLKEGTGPEMLGNVQYVNPKSDPGVIIANIWGQEFFGSDGRKYANLDALGVGLRKVFAYADWIGLDLYIPKIGSGLAGLSWENEVFPLIEEINNSEYKDVRVNVYIWP
jgi:O-acetyl-ADP-ribose deacetylase (regulator of RNase III)